MRLSPTSVADETHVEIRFSLASNERLCAPAPESSRRQGYSAGLHDANLANCEHIFIHATITALMKVH